jgi:hypothetical protein
MSSDGFMTDSGVIAVRFASVRRTEPQPLAASWPELVAALSEHVERADKLAGALWSPVSYCDGARRSLAGVDQVFAFVADLDGHDLAEVLPYLDGIAHVAYTTHSHRPGEPAWHLVVPLAEPVDAERWPAVWYALDRRFGGLADHACRDASRAYFMPQHAPDAPFAVVVGDGEPIGVPAVSAAPPPVRRAYGKRVEPRRSRPAWLDEAWWHEPQDLSRFEGKTKREKLEMLYAEFQDLRRTLGLTHTDA